MNKRSLHKWLLLAALLTLVCALLSGCIVEPEPEEDPTNTSTWKRYTEVPAVTDSPEPVATPTPDPNQQSWNAPTGGPVETPSPSPTIGIATIVPGVVSTSTPTLEPGATESVLIRRGDQGDRVKNVQESLRRLGYFEGKADGDFGEYTENAVKEFQRMNKLTPDGIVGPSTLTKLGSSNAATAAPKSTPTKKVTATPKPTKKVTATPKPTKKVTATPKPTHTPKISNVYLSKGSDGNKVTQLQNRLIELGYLVGNATGRLDSVTEAAVIAFQQRSNLDADGIAGPGTLEKLYSNSAKHAKSVVGIIGNSLKKGDEGDAVRALQSRLKALGYLSGQVDGSYGQATVDAVKAFQRANGISADGKAGHSTFTKLFADNVKEAAEVKANVKTATPEPNTFIKVTKAPNGEYVTLEKGTMGNLVSKLQRALKNAGYFKGTVDGYYGEDTVEAVKRFQRDKGLTQDGKAGPATQRYLYEGDFPNES